MRIVREEDVVIGKSLEEDARGILFSNEFDSKDYYDYFEQEKRPIKDFLICLVVFKIISKEESERHLAALEKDKRRRKLQELKRTLEEMSENEFLKEYLENTKDRIPEMLTGESEEERRAAKAVMMLKGWLSD